MALKTGFEVKILVKIPKFAMCWYFKIPAHYNFHYKASFKDFKVILVIVFRNVKKNKKNCEKTIKIIKV